MEFANTFSNTHENINRQPANKMYFGEIITVLNDLFMSTKGDE